MPEMFTRGKKLYQIYKYLPQREDTLTHPYENAEATLGEGSIATQLMADSELKSRVESNLMLRRRD